MVDSLLGRRKPRQGQQEDAVSAEPELTPAPLRRRADNRLVRSILLGTVAVVFSIYWLGRSFDVDWEALLGYAFTSLAFVALFIAAALICALLFWLLRRLTAGKGRSK